MIHYKQNKRKNNIATSGVSYKVATIEYAKNNTALNNATIIQQTSASQTKVLIDYLTIKYPPC